MGDYIITGIEREKGGIFLHLWGEDAPVSVPVELPIVIPSLPLPQRGKYKHGCMHNLFYELKRNSVKADVKAEKRIRLSSSVDSYASVPLRDVSLRDCVPVGDFYALQLVSGSNFRSSLFKMKKQFDVVGSKARSDSRNNLARLHKLQVGWPFSTASLDGGVVRFDHSSVDIDTLCSLPSDAFDAEFEGWESAHDFGDLDVDPAILISELQGHYESQKMSLESELSGVDARRAALSCYDDVSLLVKRDLDALDNRSDDLKGSIQGLSDCLSSLHSLPKSKLVRRYLDHKIDKDPYAPFQICYATSGDFPNFCFSKYPLSNDSEFVETPLGSATFHNVVVESPEEMPVALERIVSLCDPKYEVRLRSFFEEKKHAVLTASDAMTYLFSITKRAYNAFLTGGHNIDSYDFPNIRGGERRSAEDKGKDRKGSLFRSGAGGVPARQVKVGFRYRAVEPGRFNIDTLHVMEKLTPGTVDNKLVSFMRHIGVEENKSLTYEETSKLRIENACGNLASGDVCARYCMMDTLWHFFAMESVKRSVLLSSMLCSKSPEEVVSTDYKRVSENLLQLRSLSRRGCYAPSRFGDAQVSYDDFDIERDKNRILFSVMKKSLFEDGVSDSLAERLSVRAASSERADVFYLTPFVWAFDDVASRNPVARSVLGEIDALPRDGIVSAFNRSMLAQVLQRHYLSVLVHAVLNASPERGLRTINTVVPSESSHAFEELLGKDLCHYHNNVFYARRRFHELLSSHHVDVVNYGRWSVLKCPAQDRQQFIEGLESERMGFFYASANVLSLPEQGRFLLFTHELLGEGIDPKFSGGLKNEYETSFLDGFCSLVLRDRDYSAALDLLERTVYDLRSGAVPLERLLFERTVRRSPEERSGGVKDRHGQMQVLHGARKGDIFGWTYTVDGKSVVPDVYSRRYDRDLLLRMMFGEAAGDGKSLKFYNYFDDAGARKSAQTISGKLVEAAFVYNSSDELLRKEKKQALLRLVKYEHSESDKTVLLEE